MEETNKTKRAVIYARTSSVDGDAIGDQIDKACHYCLNNTIGIVGIYIDCGCSDRKFDRPKFMEMLEKINTDTVNCVLVSDADRLTRDSISLHLFKQVMRDKNIELIFTAGLPYTEVELAQSLMLKECLKNTNAFYSRTRNKAFPLKHQL